MGNVCTSRSKEGEYVVKTEVDQLVQQHPHWSLKGPFAPVSSETFKGSLHVEGTLPPELNGEYVRNGPNRVWNLPSAETQWHWFLGDGMLHGVRVQDGKASYASHFLRTSKFLQEQARGGPVTEALQARSLPEFLVKTVASTIGIMAGSPANESVSNTAIAFHNSRAIALCEADYPLEFRILEDGRLASEAQYLYTKQKIVPNAHPKVDPVTGEMYWLNYDTRGINATFDYGVLGPEGDVRSQCSGQVDGGKAVMMHDMGITEKHAIVIACPILVNVRYLQSDGTLWKYDPSHGARIGIFPRNANGNVDALMKWFNIKPCFIFHLANCWQEGDSKVVMIAVRWESVDMSGIKPPNLLDKPSTLHKYVFDLESGAVEEIELFAGKSFNMEFPVIHPKHVGRPCRYIYTVGRTDVSQPDFHRAMKLDLETNEMTTYAFNEKGTPWSSGECIFVPKAGEGHAEDAGYLVSFVMDPEGKSPSQFRVLDAQNMEAPLAVVQLPVRVPHGFHGLWITEEQLKQQHQWEHGDPPPHPRL